MVTRSIAESVKIWCKSAAPGTTARDPSVTLDAGCLSPHSRPYDSALLLPASTQLIGQLLSLGPLRRITLL
jgi:hypothetical protein